MRILRCAASTNILRARSGGSIPGAKFVEYQFFGVGVTETDAQATVGLEVADHLEQGVSAALLMSDDQGALACRGRDLVVQPGSDVTGNSHLTGLEHDGPDLAGITQLLFELGVDLTLRLVEDELAFDAALVSDIQAVFGVGIKGAHDGLQSSDLFGAGDHAHSTCCLAMAS